MSTHKYLYLCASMDRRKGGTKEKRKEGKEAGRREGR
jgi:hypothetical protein